MTRLLHRFLGHHWGHPRLIQRMDGGATGRVVRTYSTQSCPCGETRKVPE